MKWLKILLLSAAVSPASMALASDTGKLNLQSCKAANVRIHDLAIGANGTGVRSFYEGSVLVLQIDQVEPAAASSGLIVLMTDPDSEIGDRKCLAATYYNYLDIDAAKSSYDPKKGVTLIVPASDYNAETGRSVQGRPLVLTINAAKGEVTASR